MKILQINASDTGIGGASKMALDLHNEYRKYNLDAHFLSGTGTQISDPSFHAIPQQYGKKILARLMSNDIEFFNSDFIFKQDYYKNADIVHFHNIHGWYFNLTTFKKICAEKKVIWTLHDQWALTSHCAHTTSNELRNGLYTCDSQTSYPSLLWDNTQHLSKIKKQVYETVPFTVVTPSIWLKNRATPILDKKHNIQIIPNGINTDIFNPVDKVIARKNLKLPSNKKILLFVAAGGLDNEFKGGDFIRKTIEYLKNDPRYYFVIIGKKDNKLEKSYSSVQTFDAIHNQRHLAEYYSAAEALLFPSQFENAPLTILESLACNTPVIATDVGGIPDVVTHLENGYLIKKFDDIIAGIDWATIQNKGVDCCTVTKNYSLASVAKNYLALYKQII